MGNCESHNHKENKKSKTEVVITVDPETQNTKKRAVVKSRTSVAHNPMKKKISEDNIQSTLRNFNRKSTKINENKIKPKFSMNEIEVDPKANYYNFIELLKTKELKSWIVISKETKKKRILYESPLSRSLNEKKKLDVLLNLSHINILTHFDYFTFQEKLYYTTEFSDKGTLQDIINSKEQINEGYICSLTYQVLKAILHIHRLKILHGNINPLSIYIYNDKINENYPIVKIGSFEWAKIFKEQEIVSDIVGGSEFQAPEVKDLSFNEKIDIWSLGVTIYYTFFNSLPLVSDENGEISIKLNFPEKTNYSKELQDFLREIIQFSPEMRPTALKASNHIWFKKHGINFFFDPDNFSIVKIIRNMRRKNLIRIRKEVKKFLIQNLSNSPNLLEIYKVFEYFDINSDGTVSKDEIINKYINLLKYLKNIDYDQNDPKYGIDIDAIFKEYDDDQDGQFQREEFVRASLDLDFFICDESIDLLYNFLAYRTDDNVNFTSFDYLFIKTHWEGKFELFKSQYKQFNLKPDSFVSKKKFQTLFESLLKLPE